VVSVTDPYGRILGFLDRSRYSFFQAAIQLYPLGSVNLATVIIAVGNGKHTDHNRELYLLECKYHTEIVGSNPT
jgi:hypothetical protein